MINSVTIVAPKMNLTEIVKSFSNRLKGFILKRVNNLEDAEDILQDVFFKLAESDRLMKPIDQLSAWLFTVTRNRITDHYRKRKTESLPYFSNDEENFTELLDNIMPDDSDSPEVVYLHSLIWEEFMKALQELPEEQRLVFQLHEMEGVPFKEISKRTGLPVNTLISRKRYAILFLRERLNKLYLELLNFK